MRNTSDCAVCAKMYKPNVILQVFPLLFPLVTVLSESVILSIQQLSRIQICYFCLKLLISKGALSTLPLKLSLLAYKFLGERTSFFAKSNLLMKKNPQTKKKHIPKLTAYLPRIIFHFMLNKFLVEYLVFSAVRLSWKRLMNSKSVKRQIMP